jgi:hypothetical protein
MRRVNPVLAFACFGFHLEQRLPLAFGERVPFFARAKKVGKETRPSA